MRPANPAYKGRPVIPSPSPVILSEAKDLALLLKVNSARNLALILYFRNQCGIPRYARNDSGGLSTIMLAPLLAAILACNLPGLGQQTPVNPPLVNVDDEGVFLISAAGKSVGSESFKIHSSAGKVEARGEIRLHIEQNGKKVNVQSFPDLVLDPLLRPITYTWNQQGPQSSRLEVDFRGRLANVRYQTINGNEDDRDFALPPDVLVLDDNVIHHYELIIARFLAMGGGKQTFHVFVPQEALPSLLTVEDTGNTATTAGAAVANLRHLLITTDVTRFDLWLDQQQHLERVLVPSAQLEAVRKR